MPDHMTMPDSAPAASVRAALLARQVRGDVVESQHLGHIAVVDAGGLVTTVAGDPGHVVMLRSVGKPFALVALLTAPGVVELGLRHEEIAVMAGSHSGEDLHVRVLQDLVARIDVDPSLLVCGSDDAPPLDRATAARLLRDGERPGRLRHQCSGQHLASLLLARLGGWSPDGYWEPDHPSQRAIRTATADLLGVAADALPAAIDGCATQTYAAPLGAIARLHALLAHPRGSVGSATPAASALQRIRDAMLAHPRLLGGTGDRLDTVLMERRPGRLTVKVGAEGLAGLAVLPDGDGTQALGIAIKIDDGDPTGRALSAVAVEVLLQLGVLSAEDAAALDRFRSPAATDSLGRIVAHTVATPAPLLNP